MKILGIDPGTAIVGYGVIETGPPVRVESCGVIRTPAKTAQAKRLLEIHREIRDLCQTYQPEIAVVEKLFFFKNQKTIMQVAEARGTILLALAQEGVRIEERTPLEVKQAIAGYGRAPKEQVQFMVKNLLKLPLIPQPDDAADALALAACFLRNDEWGQVAQQ